MKRIIALALSLLLVASLGMTASAATINSVPANEEGDVVINVNPDGSDVTEVTKVYKVDIAWESLEFDFTLDIAKEDLEYDESSHTYTNITGTWQADLDANITVTNHSNAAVTPTVQFVGGGTSATNHGVTANITEAVANTATLASAEGTAAGVTNVYTVTIDGTTTPNVIGFTLAKVVVSIAAV